MCNTVKMWTHFPLFKKANSMLKLLYKNIKISLTTCLQTCHDGEDQKNDTNSITVRCDQQARRVFYTLTMLVPQRQAGQWNLNEWRPHRQDLKPEVERYEANVRNEHTLPNKSLRQLHAHREDQKHAMRNGDANLVPEVEYDL